MTFETFLHLVKRQINIHVTGNTLKAFCAICWCPTDTQILPTYKGTFITLSTFLFQLSVLLRLQILITSNLTYKRKIIQAASKYMTHYQNLISFYL